MAQIFAINWIEVTAVRQPQIWHNERMADGFTQFLHKRYCLFRHFRPRWGCSEWV